jgi:RNase P subunit RPR2
MRPNERFSGKGRRAHVCRECSHLPGEEIRERSEEREIVGFIRQSHISERNVSRLEKLAESENARIAELARTVLEVARFKPHRRRRFVLLARERPDLLRKLEEMGLD